jgi:hypothetical protein
MSPIQILAAALAARRRELEVFDHLVNIAADLETDPAFPVEALHGVLDAFRPPFAVAVLTRTPLNWKDAGLSLHTVMSAFVASHPQIEPNLAAISHALGWVHDGRHADALPH